MAIERKFVTQNIHEYRIKKFIEEQVTRVGLSDVKLKKTPLGDKIIIFASRPGLVVGRGGANIQQLTKDLNKKFNLENPQIEIEEVQSPDLDADIVAERIVNSLERFGSGRTKGIGHRAMQDTMNAGALGVEIIISGKIPSMRARSWRFYMGYLKKAGDIAIEGVSHSIKNVTLKSGAVGVKVSIMPPTIELPDHITLTDSTTVIVEAPAETKETPAEPPVKEQVKKPAEKETEKPVEEKKEVVVAKTKEVTKEKVSVPETKNDSGTKEESK